MFSDLFEKCGINTGTNNLVYAWSNGKCQQMIIWSIIDHHSDICVHPNMAVLWVPVDSSCYGGHRAPSCLWWTRNHSRSTRIGWSQLVSTPSYWTEWVFCRTFFLRVDKEVNMYVACLEFGGGVVGAFFQAIYIIRTRPSASLTGYVMILSKVIYIDMPYFFESITGDI